MRVIDVDALNEKLEHLAIQRIKGDDGYDVLTVSLAEVLRMIDGLSTIELETTFADRMSRKLDALGLPVREYNCLRRYGIDTIAELYKVQQNGMLPKVRNLGRESMERVEKALDEFIRVEQLPPAELGTNLAEVGTNCSEFPNNSDAISRQAAIDILDAYQVMIENGKENPYSWARLRMSELPPAQPERTCVNCGRTINNGGWYADGRTRCPIEEHYALPKDGFCHLWEKRNVTDDDYPERREE